MVVRIFLILLLPQILMGQATTDDEVQSVNVFSVTEDLELPSNATLVTFRSDPEVQLQNYDGQVNICVEGEWESLLIITNTEIHATMTDQLLTLCSGEFCSYRRIDAAQWDIHPSLDHHHRRSLYSWDTDNGGPYSGYFFAGCGSWSTGICLQPNVAGCITNYCPYGWNCANGTYCTGLTEATWLDWIYNNEIEWGKFDTVSSYGVELKIGSDDSAQDNNDPYPLQNKGYWFAGGDDYMKMSASGINADYTMMGWFRVTDPGDNRYMALTEIVNEAGANQNHWIGFRTYAGSHYNSRICVITQHCVLSTHNFAFDDWVHVAWSMNYQATYQYNWYLYQGSVSHAGQGTMANNQRPLTDNFVMDKYIGVNTTWVDYYKGMIFSLKMRNIAYGDANALAADDQNVSAYTMWDCAWNTYTANCYTCDGSCSEGCVRFNNAMDCKCYDVECADCTSYNDGTCPNCTATANGSGTNEGTCGCASGYGRASKTVVCTACQPYCESCTQYHDSYRDCTECLNSPQAYTANTNGNHYYQCNAACPTGMSASDQFCTLDGSSMIAQFSWALASKDPVTLGPGGTSSIGALSITVSSTQTTGSNYPSMYPQRSRGLFMNDSYTSDHIYVSSLQLNFNFSIHMWFMREDLNTNSHLFYKPRDESTGNYHISSYIDTNNNLRIAIGSAYDNSSCSSQGTTSLTLGMNDSNAWYNFVASIQMTDGYNYYIRAFLNRASAGSESLSHSGGDPCSSFVMRDTDSEKLYIGSAKQHNSLSNNFNGYLYAFTIYQTTSSNGQETYNSGGCMSSAGCLGYCLKDDADQSAQCLLVIEFQDYYDTDTSSQASCDASCNWTGCINSQICKTDGTCSSVPCNQCDDRECRNCSGAYNVCTDCNMSGNCESAAAFNGCHCNDDYGRETVDVYCVACYTGCDLCNLYTNSFRDCKRCKPGFYATAYTEQGTAAWKVCEAQCPSGFTDSAGFCSATGYHIVKYDFNFPHITPVNTGVNDPGGITVTVTQVDNGSQVPSAYPQKNRGLYFDGSQTAFVKIESVVLHQTWAVHMWIKRQVQNTQMSLFSKDRGDANGAWLSHYIYIATNNKIKAEIANALDGAQCSNYESSGTVANQSWKYIVVEYKNKNGYQTTTESWIDQSSQGAVDCGASNNPKFALDESGWPIYLAIDRTAANSYTDRYNGFIFEMHLYQAEYDNSSGDHFANSSCPGPANPCTKADDGSELAMWNANFARFRNDDGSDTACNASGNTCQYTGCFWIATDANPSDMECKNCLVKVYDLVTATGGNKYCNMCYDRECALCTSYATDTCTVCGLKYGEDDVDNNGQCYCVDGYGREDYDSGETLDWCAPCHTGCGVCTRPISRNDDFEYCTRCLDSMKQTEESTVIFCYDECPTGYAETADANPRSPDTCAITNTNIVEFRFSKPTHAYTNTGSAEADESDASRKPAWTLTQSPPGGQPAKFRGIYFDTNTSNYGTISQVNLNRNFSVHMWVMLKRLNTKQMFWSKDRNTWGSNQPQRNIEASIESNNDLQVTIARDTDATDTQDVSQSISLPTVDITSDTWYYIVWSFDDSSGGGNLQIQVFVDTVRYANDTKSQFCLKDNTTWPMTIAIQRASSGNSQIFQNKLHGFISLVSIWQIGSAGNEADHWVSSGTDVCQSTDLVDCQDFECAMQSKTCLWTEDFDKFRDWWQEQTWGTCSTAPACCLDPLDINHPCPNEPLCTCCTEANPCVNISCHASCSLTGCNNHEACISESDCAALQSGTGDKYCNLCHDRECANCLTYENDMCSVCGVSGNYVSLVGGVESACHCDDWYGRLWEDVSDGSTYNRGYRCRQCWHGNPGNCITCARENDSDYKENYSVCYECLTGTHETAILANYRYCQLDEPIANNFGNCQSSPSSSNCAGLSYVFTNNFVTFPNEVAAASDGVPTVTIVQDLPSGLTGAFRGIWYATSNTVRVGFDAEFALRHTFTIYSWIWPLNNGSTRTIFSKDRNASGVYSYQLWIDNGNEMWVKVTKDNDASEGTARLGSSYALTDKYWHFIAVSNECNNHEDTTVKFYKQGSQSGSTHTINDKCLDDKNEWTPGAFIGVDRTNTSPTYANYFSGFIYDFHLHQRGRTSADRNLYRLTSGCDWGSNSCAATSDDVFKWDDAGNSNSMLWKIFYNHWYSAVRTCDASCTTTYSDMGCDSEGLCLDPSGCDASANSNTNCHMCFDYHCTGCTGKHDAMCTTGCRGTATHSTDIWTCDNNFQADQYTRQDRTSPCCERHCGHCFREIYGTQCLACCQSNTSGGRGECFEKTYEQPTFTIATNQFVICNSDCPTGYYQNGNGCSIDGSTTTLVVDWDLTWIARPIYNYAPGQSHQSRPDDPPSGWSNFGPGLPYKLRGTWFGTNAATGKHTGLRIDGFQFHHEFTMIWWLKLEGTSGSQAIFSKDRGDSEVNGNSDENVWEYHINGGNPELKIWNKEGGAWESQQTASAYITDTNWYFLAFSTYYDGSNMTVKHYYNAGNAESFTYSDLVYVLDRRSWTNTSQFWMGSARSTDGSDPSVETPINGGFIYSVKIYQEEVTNATFNPFIKTNVADCYGKCQSGHCPAYNSNWNYDGLHYCLWEVDRDKWEDFSGTAGSCWIKSTIDDTTLVDCPIEQGCQREADCNRCRDRLCEDCNNFDQKALYCTNCIANSAYISNNNNNNCECDDNFWYDDAYPLADASNQDYTDKCVDCDVACKKCSSLSYKACTECRTNYYKQETAQTCVDFCPTGYTYGSEICTGSPESTMVFQFKLSTWHENFTYIQELVGGQDILQLGSSSTWTNDDPWLDRAGTLASVQFTASSQQHITILNASSGDPGLLINDDFTVTLWINPNAVSGVQTLLSKTNQNSNVDAVGKEKMLAFGLNSANIQCEFTTSTLSERASSTGITAISEDFSNATYVSTGDHIVIDTWVHVSITLNSAQSADIKFFKNGIQIHYQTPQPVIQFSDKKTNIDTLIGCGKEYNNATPINCYDGFIYEMQVYQINLSQFVLEDKYTYPTGTFPDLTNKCAEKQYYDTVAASCTACSTTASYPTKVDTFDECTICGSILCDQCVGLGDSQCTSCTAGHTLSANPGSCSCPNGQYFNTTTGVCTNCATGCDTCHGAYEWTCTVCSSLYYKQPNTSATYTCTDVCPLGYYVNGSVCSDDGVISDNALLDFATINDRFSDGNVSYDSGETSASDPDYEPWTYKNRGAWFDGDDLLHLDGTFYLFASSFTWYTWIRPEDNGTLFSKSYSDWSNPAEFFDVKLFGMELYIDITGASGDTKTAIISAVVAVRNWNMTGFTFSYDRTIGANGNICNIQGYLNGVTRTTVALFPTAILEKANTDSAIGARLDSAGASYTVTNHYTGFIYKMYYYGNQVDSESTMNNLVRLNGDGATCVPDGACTLCPRSDDTCLWNCYPDEWFNDDSSSFKCEPCATCAVPHENTWDGCVAGDNCALCDDDECATCSGFQSGTCTACLSDTDDDTNNCSCNSSKLYNASAHACQGCDTACTVCDGFYNYNCSSCDTGYRKQTGATVCLPFCPTAWTDHTTYCSSTTNYAIQLNFTEITKTFGTTWQLQNAAGGPTVEQSDDTLRSLAVKSRGHWFEGDHYWELMSLNMHHTFVLRAWIRPKLNSTIYVIFSNNKDIMPNTPSRNPKEDLIELYIRSDNYLEANIMDDALTRITNRSTNTVTDAKWNMVAMFAQYHSETYSTLDLWINQTKQTQATSNDAFFLEYNGAKKILGAEYNHNGTAWVVENNFKGFMYKFDIINNSRTDAEVISDVRQYGSDFGPETEISECEKGTWINGASCEACDATCTEANSDLTNCVRAGSGQLCTLCDERLCNTCETFDSGDAAKCQTCVTSALLTSPSSCVAQALNVPNTTCDPQTYDCTCTCLSSQYAASPLTDSIECTCVANCATCTELDKYHCITCATDYFQQLDTNMICLTYCGFDQSQFAEACVDNNSGRIFRTFSDIDWTATGSADPWPMKQRGHWFNGSTHFYSDTNNVVFHHSMVIDAFIRPNAVTNGTSGTAAQRTIFSRNKNDNSSTGAEDYVSWYIRTDSVMEVSFTTNFVQTVTGGTSAGDLIDDGSWEYVAVRWAFTYVDGTNDSTEIYLLKRASVMSTTTVTGLAYYVEDAGTGNTWTGYIGREDDSSGAAAVQAKFYSGFMYEIGWSNKDITFTDQYDTSGCTQHCTDFCPSATTHCLSDCEYLEFPSYSSNIGSCSACKSECTRGCVYYDSCSLCHDMECDQCAHFLSGAICNQCYTGKTSSTSATACACDDYPTGNGWYSTITDLCYPCHKHCTSCISQLSRMSSFDCTYDNACITDYDIICGTCQAHCPTGWTTNNAQCSDNTSAVDKLILHYRDFTLFTNTDTDLILGYIAYRGTNDNYNDYWSDPENPRVQYYGGLHFDGSDILQFPPNTAETNANNRFVMNCDQTVVMIIRPDMWSNISHENEVLVYKGNGTTDTWRLYLTHNTKQLKLKMDHMRHVIVEATDQDQEITFDTFVDDGLWHSLAVSSNLISVDWNVYQNDYIAYVDGVQIGSTQTISEFYIEDEPENYFVFGGAYDSSVLNPSYRGNLYDFKIYNAVKDQLFISQDQHTVKTGDLTWCACNQCYAGSECLTHCYWNEFLVEVGQTCRACQEECGQGCMDTDFCTLNTDPKCSVANSWIDCASCINLAELKAQTDPTAAWVCDCIDNAYYSISTNTCICNAEENYQELTNGTCEPCFRYLLASEVSGTYDDSYHYIEVSFYIKIRTDFFRNQECTQFIDTTSLQKLGTNPLCQWEILDEVTENGVYVKLKITPGTTATFAEENLLMIGSALYTSEIGNCPHAAQTNIQPFVYYPTDVTPPAPVALFTANIEFSLACDDLYLDASGSLRELHRSLVYQWDIRNKATNSQVESYLSTPIGDQEFQVVTVPRTSFTAGDYSVTLTVTNWGGLSDSKTTDIKVLSADTPSLSMVFSADTTTVAISEQRELDVTVTNNCISAAAQTGANAIQYVYGWSMVSGPANMFGNALGSTTNKVTFLNSFTQTGTYVIQVQATGGDYSGIAQISLEIVHTDLQCKLSAAGGDVSLRNAFVLDASGSTDPDGGQLDYLWTCSDSVLTDCGQFFTTTNMNVPIQTIPANSMTAEVTYTFTITITPRNADSTDTRTASRTVTITAKDNNAPALLVKDIGERVAPQNILRLEMTPSTTEGVTTTWTQTKGPTLSSSQFLTTSDLNYLVIAENVLSPGDTYRFELRALQNFDSATATIEFSVNMAPSSGQFLASPATGTELTTDYTLIASAWIDPEDTDYPLLYGFQHLDASNNPKWMQKPLDKDTYTSTLPYTGSASVTVQLYVIDSLYTPTTTTLTVGVTALSDSERQAVVETAIQSLATENTQDIPALINKYAVNGALTNETQLDALADKFNSYLLDIVSYTPDSLDSGISAFKSLAETDQATNRTETLLGFVDKLCAGSEDTGGMTRAQANNLLEAIDSIDPSPAVTNTQLQQVLETATKNMLPGEPDFTHETNNLKFNSRRTVPSALSSTEQLIPNSNSKISLPANLLARSEVASDNNNTLVDARLTEYPPHEGPQGTKSAIVDYELVQIGVYENNEIQYHDTPQTLEIGTIEDWILIYIHVTNMHAEFTPECVYASNIDPVTGAQTWSPDGCELQQVRQVEGTVICRCNHLSRFTAGEELYTIPTPTIAVVAEAAADGFNSELPVMIIFLGVLLLTIIITAIAEKVYDQRSKVWHSKSPTTGTPRLSGLVINQADYSDPIIVIGESKFDDSLFSTPEASMHVQNPTPKNKKGNIKSVGARMLPFDRKSANSKQSPDPVEPTQEANVTKRGSSSSGLSSPSIIIEDSGFMKEFMDADIKEQKKPFWKKHLVFGKCAGSRPAPSVRSLIICTVLIMEMALVGGAYYTQYAVTEETDDEFEITDASWWREPAVGGVCSFAGLAMASIIAIVHAKIPVLGWMLSILTILISSTIVIYMSFVFVQLWSLVWMFGWLCCAAIDIFAGHIVVMWITHSIFKIDDED